MELALALEVLDTSSRDRLSTTCLQPGRPNLVDARAGRSRRSI
jgi:hypothetical protein